MTISSLEDLNTYALTPITYNDVRTAQVIFDRGAVVNQTLTINENNTFVFPWGININDVTQYDIAEVEYKIDLSNFTSPVSITWPTFPSHMTVSRVGTTNVWIVEDIRSQSDWLLARQATVQPQFGFSGNIQFTGEISYYSDNQDSSREQVSWTVDLTVNPVQYFTTPPSLTYVSNEIKTNMSIVNITNAGAGSFDPEWTLTISATAGTISGFTSDASPAEFSIDPTTGTVTIIGDTTSVNAALNSIDVYFARSDADCVLFFNLTNDLTSSSDIAVQLIESRDFISDQNTEFSTTAAENIIRGATASLPVIGSITADNTKIIQFSGSAAGAFGTSATGRADFSGSGTLPAEFGSIFYFIWGDIQSEFSIVCRPHVWYVQSSTNAGPIYDDTMFTLDTSGAARTIKQFDLNSASISGASFADPNFTDPSTSFGNETSVDSDGTYVVIGNYAVDTADRFLISSGFRTNLPNPDLYPSNGTDAYGQGVAMSDSYTIIGAWAESASSTDSSAIGAVYVWNTAAGTVKHEIPNPTVASGEWPAGPGGGTVGNFRWGQSVDISDDYFVVGMPLYYDGTDTIGRVYLYNSSTGQQETYFDRPSTGLPSGADSEFGTTVKISGNYIVVFDTGYGNYPAIYVYNATTRQLIWQRISTVTGMTGQGIFNHTIDVNSTSVGALIDGHWTIFNLATGDIEHRFTNADMSFGSALNTTFFMDEDWAVFDTAAGAAVIIQI